jgi:hypothetical protein
MVAAWIRRDRWGPLASSQVKRGSEPISGGSHEEEKGDQVTSASRFQFPEPRQNPGEVDGPEGHKDQEDGQEEAEVPIRLTIKAFLPCPSRFLSYQTR